MRLLVLELTDLIVIKLSVQHTPQNLLNKVLIDLLYKIIFMVVTRKISTRFYCTMVW